MQILLSHATAIPPLLEGMNSNTVDMQSHRAAFSEMLKRLRDWEDSFVADSMLVQAVDPKHFDLPIDSLFLPNPCSTFSDVSHANCLTHCWAFRIVCLMELARLETSLESTTNAFDAGYDRHAEVKNLCHKICKALPYLLQRDMSLYGSMSAGYPLHVVSESLRITQVEDRDLITWCTTIKYHIQNRSIVLYEDMDGPVPST